MLKNYNQVKSDLIAKSKEYYNKYKEGVGANPRNNKKNWLLLEEIASYPNLQFEGCIDYSVVNLGVIFEQIVKKVFLDNKTKNLHLAKGKGFDAVVNGSRVEIKSFILDKPTPIKDSSKAILLYDGKDNKFIAFKPHTFTVGDRIIKSRYTEGVEVTSREELAKLLEAWK